MLIFRSGANLFSLILPCFLDACLSLSWFENLTVYRAELLIDCDGVCLDAGGERTFGTRKKSYLFNVQK